jgi:hypothetical protein
MAASSLFSLFLQLVVKMIKHVFTQTRKTRSPKCHVPTHPMMLAGMHPLAVERLSIGGWLHPTHVCWGEVGGRSKCPPAAKKRTRAWVR